jgi:hypothetical protein
MNRGDNANEIISRLWLGNSKSSQDQEFLRKHNITVVFNCTKNLAFSPIVPIKYRVPVDDNLKEEEIRNMELWSGEIAFRIIKHYMNGETILVHCAAGMQRSAASVAFMLISYLRMRGSEAIEYIKERRPIAFYPRANFGRSIDYFDRRFHSEILPEMKKLPSPF